MMHKITVYIMFSCALALTGCYSFKGISIPVEVETFYIPELTLKTPNAPADIGQTFSEFLKQKFLNETKLNFDDLTPHIEFVGELTRYQVTSVAPQPGETTAFNRLAIAVRLDYTNNLDEEDKWSNTFSFYQDYNRDDNLLDIQDELIQVIFTQIGEDVFNKAFTNW
ncbi:MAG: hypothetical protein KTR24_10675 [Saprospiraceae bacterium]|nr:hypothetical protein [Saprospiraceae bacterium]